MFKSLAGEGSQIARLAGTDGLASDTRSLSALALAWIDRDLIPRVIVDEKLVILWANVAARGALASRRDLEVRASVLSTANPLHQSDLAGTILSSGAVWSTGCIPRSDGDGFLIVRSQRISWDPEAAYGVCFSGTGSDFKDEHAEFRGAFNLTNAEHRVVMAMLDGLEPREIAEEQGVSIETTRSHVRAIYAKLGVSSRQALFRKLRAFRV